MSGPVTRFVRTVVGPNPGAATDAELLRRFADRRDADAFELLVHRHAGMVGAACRAILRDAHLAEDAAQATFLILARRAAGVRENPAGWLYRTARHVALRMRRSRRAVGVSPSGPGADLLRAPRPDRTGLRPPLAADELATLHAELAALPDRYRLPLLLCHLEGLSHADAAARLGWPLGTLSGRLSRARARLRDRLTRRGLAPVLAVAVGGHTAFAANTCRLAVAFAAGDATGVPLTVLPLVHGALRAMTIAKLKLAAGLVAACGALTAGGVWAGGQAGAGGPPGGAGLAPQPPAGAAAPPPRVERLKVDPQAPNPGRPEDPKRNADYAARRQSLKNLKQILVAWHNTSDAYVRLPGNVVGPDGKPLLSWRVHLLPFLEQGELYKQFKLDEPWHSPTNKPLLAKMPAVYRTAFQPKDAIHTYYQGFAGPGTVFEPGRQVGMANITDGSSNTLAIAEVGPPVAWTEPADVPYDPAAKFPAVVWPFANVLNLGLADGSVRQLSPTVGELVFRRLVERNDGYVTPDLNVFKPSFPEEAAEERAAAGRVLAENQALLEKIAGLLKEQGELMRAEPAAGNPDRQEAIRNHLRQLAEQLAARNERMKGK